MNPLSLVPSWVWAVAIAVLTAAVVGLSMENSALKLKVEQGKTYVAVLEGSIERSNREAAEQAKAFTEQAAQALAASKVRERKLASDATRANTELERLSHAATSYTLSRRATTIAPSLDTPDLYEELFLDCSRRYSRVAKEADQWESDAVTLYEAWPTVNTE